MMPTTQDTPSSAPTTTTTTSVSTTTDQTSSSNSKRKRNKKKRKKSRISSTSTTTTTSDDNNDYDTSQSNNEITPVSSTTINSNAIISSSNGNSNNGKNHTILNSKLSLKKRLYLKKITKQTPWYDINELLETGRGLLLALQLFPSGTTTASTTTTNNNNDDATTLTTTSPTTTTTTTATTTATTPSSPLPTGLTSGERDRLRDALRRVALWKGRSSDRGTVGRLPHAIDITAGLAEILLLDAEQQQQQQQQQRQQRRRQQQQQIYNSPPISHGQLRNAYSTLLLRSVNGLADTYRHQKKSSSLSVSHCCALAGLPLWIVDVRHDASHNDLPGLGVCRIGALESLRFWGGRYWMELEDGVSGVGGGSGGMGGASGGVLGEMMDGPSSSSSSNREGCGIRTLAFDCLTRYQNAAFSEALSREVKKNQQQQQQQQQHGSTSGAREEERRNNQRVAKGGDRYDDATNTTALSQENNVKAREAKFDDAMMIDVPFEKINGRSKKIGRENPNNDEEQQQHSEEDDESTIPARQKGCANPWSILDDSKPKKKKKKKKSTGTTDTAAEEGNTTRSDTANIASAVPPASSSSSSAKEDGTAARGASASANASIAIPPSSSRDCAAEFVRTIPMDVASSTALRFLVWGEKRTVAPSRDVDGSGGDVDAGESGGGCGGGSSSGAMVGDDNDGPALLTLPPSECIPVSKSKLLDTTFEQLRTMYDPLLIAMTSAYPGFAVALFVHLTDSILCLDALRRSQLGNNNNNTTEDASTEPRDETMMLDPNQLDRNIRYLSRWMRYVLSREYHMHYDRSAAICDGAFASSKQQRRATTAADGEPASQQQPMQRVDLKKKGRKKWNAAEVEYMRGALDFSSLSEIGFPLNSVCDRLHSHRKEFPFNRSGERDGVDSDAASTVGSLQQILEDVVGEERVVCMEIHGHDGTASSCDRDDATKEITSVEGEETNPVATLLESGTAGTSKASRGDPLRATNNLSLEDMEAMFRNDDVESNTVVPSAMCPPGKEDDGGQCANDGSEIVSADHGIEPWSLCATWDACAIGTMPGYPG